MRTIYQPRGTGVTHDLCKFCHLSGYSLIVPTIQIKTHLDKQRFEQKWAFTIYTPELATEEAKTNENVKFVIDDFNRTVPKLFDLGFKGKVVLMGDTYNEFDKDSTINTPCPTF